MPQAQASSSKLKAPVKATQKDDGSESEDYSSSDSEDVTEDEEGDELTPAMDAAILQTLRKIRSGQGVYEKEEVLAEALREAEDKVKSKGLNGLSRSKVGNKDKPLTVAELNRAELLAESNGMDMDEDDEPKTYVESQKQLRDQAINAFKSLAGGDDNEQDEDEGGDEGDGNGFGFELKARPKTDEEEEREVGEYRQFLLEMGGGEEEVRKMFGFGKDDVSGKGDDGPGDGEDVESKVEGDDKEQRSADQTVAGSERWQKKKQADDDFLMDYILNRGWVDRSDRHVPTYDEIVGPEDMLHGMDLQRDSAEGDEGQAESGPSRPWGVLEEDEFDEQAEEFENSYNFRFEEPGAATIHTHPREITTLVRRPDDARKAKRAARAEKKQAERAAYEEKTKRLKGEKRRDMELQLAELKKELGDKVDWDAVQGVLEGDFDEDQWERVVGEMLAKVGEDDDEKPAWDDEEDEEQYDKEMDNQQDWNQDQDQDVGDDTDGPINMDADFIDAEPSKKSKKKKKDKKDKKDKKKERAEVEEDLTVEQRAERVKEALEGYKALDHEDVIGDMPTRFKYTRSAPQSFGLTPVEILLASDAELNAIAGMKHIAPYRHRGLGKAAKGLDRRIRDLRTRLKDRKWGDDESHTEEATKSKKHRHDLNGSGGAGGSGSGSNNVPLGEGSGGGEKRKGKRLGKKERMKLKVATEGVDGTDGEPGDGEGSTVGGKRKAEDGGAVDGGGEDGSEKKKRRKKKKKHSAGDGGGGEKMLEMYE